MAEIIAEALDEDADSRTAIFERKRPHEVATRDDNSNAGSAQSTPRKRKKYAAKPGHQDVRDFVPNGGSFATDTAPLEEAETNENESPPEPVEASTAPAISWNAVNNTKIRTSLGGGLKKKEATYVEALLATQEIRGFNERQTGHNEERPTSHAADGQDKVIISQDKSSQTSRNPKTAQEQATQSARTRLEAFRDRLASMNPHDGPVSAYKAAQAEIDNAEIDYNYCLYYPPGLLFSPPPPRTYHENGYRDLTKETEYRIWEQIRKCTRDGTLQNFKAGKIKIKAFGSSAQKLDEQQVSKRLIDRGMNCRDSMNNEILHKVFEEEMKEMQSDLNYCRFFPSDEEYLPLCRAKIGLQNPPDFSNRDGFQNRRAAQIWKLVQQCEADGTLRALKDGKLDQCIRNIPTTTQLPLASAPQAGKDANHPQSHLHVGNEDMTIGNGNQGTMEILDDAKPQSPKQNNDEVISTQTNMVELSGEREKLSLGGQSGTNSDDGLVLNTYDSDRLQSAEEQILREDLNEVTQILNEIDSDQAENNDGTASEDSDSASDTDNDSGENDVIDRSNIQQAADEAVRARELRTKSQAQSARTLAELSPQDLNAQLRYFHVTKSINDIDRNTPVRCLVCSVEGHMAEICDERKCATCGALDHHTTKDCPSTAKCSKCREMGHDKQHCPYKLKNLAVNEILCDLCQRNGHVEDNCELQWRTSGRPWESSLNGRFVQLSCYECGNSGHLGNDCPTRKPGKPLGSSTWGSGDKQLSIKSKGEISIKGAAKHDPIDIDDGQDDVAGAFVRPKVFEPVRQGKIQIKTGPKSTFNDLGSNSGWNPVNAHRDSGKANEFSYGHYREDRENRQGSYGGDQQGFPDRSSSSIFGSYGQTSRRSRSPEYRKRGTCYDTYAHQPPASRDTAYQSNRHPPHADVYRPMPSSAQNAWSRHRVLLLFCDYCDVYLTHDSMSVRKAHNSGRNHERNVLDYYQQIGHEKAQSVIDSITSSYAAEGQAGSNPMLNPQGGPPPMPGQGFPPPPFGFPGGLPPPPFGMPTGGPNGVPPFLPPPGGRGMPPFPPFPPSASPAGNGPPMGMPGMPFPPPGGMPPNFQGFPPPPHMGGQQGSPVGGNPFGPPGGGGGQFGR